MKKIFYFLISLSIFTVFYLSGCGASSAINLVLEKSSESDFSKMKALRIIVREKDKNPEIFGPFAFKEDNVKLEALASPGTPFHIDVWGCASINNCEPEHIIARGCSGIEEVTPDEINKEIKITLYELAKNEAGIPVCPFEF